MLHKSTTLLIIYCLDYGIKNIIHDNLYLAQKYKKIVLKKITESFIKQCTGSLIIRTYYFLPHIHTILRYRFLCLNGRANYIDTIDPFMKYVCYSAPMWLVMQVCYLLKN